MEQNGNFSSSSGELRVLRPSYTYQFSLHRHIRQLTVISRFRAFLPTTLAPPDEQHCYAILCHCLAVLCQQSHCHCNDVIMAALCNRAAIIFFQSLIEPLCVLDKLTALRTTVVISFHSSEMTDYRRARFAASPVGLVDAIATMPLDVLLRMSSPSRQSSMTTSQHSLACALRYS